MTGHGVPDIAQRVGRDPLGLRCVPLLPFIHVIVYASQNPRAHPVLPDLEHE